MSFTHTDPTASRYVAHPRVKDWFVNQYGDTSCKVETHSARLYELHVRETLGGVLVDSADGNSNLSFGSVDAAIEWALGQ